MKGVLLSWMWWLSICVFYSVCVRDETGVELVIVFVMIVLIKLAFLLFIITTQVKFYEMINLN